MVTTVQIDNELKERLNRLKIHPRESYNDLISRLVDSYSPEVASRESLIETLEILSDPEMMRGIAQGLEDIKAGRVKTLDQISKELY
ncbi:MAG: antitoxin VapB family protein [Cuniculiplasma divulgatum]|jgi:predicted transcriptional regulator|nr:MAG: antitoxin VapB family protein [Cuniculiplasma divulgatum]